MVVGRPFVTAGESGETGPIRRIPVLRGSDHSIPRKRVVESLTVTSPDPWRPKVKTVKYEGAILRHLDPSQAFTPDLVMADAAQE